MDTKRVLKSKESSSETEESDVGSEEEIKKSRIRSSTEDEDSEGEMKQSEIEILKKSEATIKKETTEDPEEDPDVDDESEVNLKTEEESSDMVKMENDADTDACFSSDEEDQKSLEEEKSQNSEIKKEQNTSTESFEPKQENHDPKPPSDEDEPVRKKTRDVDESSDEDIPKKNSMKRKLDVSSSDEDEPVKRKNSSKKKVSKTRDRRKALESSDDEEFADDTFEEVELKPPPKTFLIEESKSEEISKIFEKIRRKWKKIGKVDKLFYLRFKIQKPLDLPNDQQYRKLIKLPNKLHHNPRCCIILKDDPEEWLKLKEELENESVWKALAQFQIIQLKEYRNRTKGAIKRRKFLKDFDLLIADNRIRKTF